MAAPSKRSPSIAARLSRKVGPLPVWAWAAVILGAYFLYTRLHGGSSSSSAASNSTPATPTDTTSGSDSGAQVPVGGGGSPVDNSSANLLSAIGANQAALDQLTSQILSQPTPYSNVDWSTLLGAPYGSDFGLTDSGGPASQPTPAASTPAPTTVSSAHPTQNTAGVLKWGGINFTTKAQFASWAKAHGTTVDKELANHPQARAIYSTLR